MKNLLFQYTLILLLSFQTINGFCQNEKTGISVIITEQENPTPVRVKITDSQGHFAPLPDEVISIMYGRNDTPERYGYQPDSSFYVDGFFQLELIPGRYEISLSKGMEYLDQTQTVDVKASALLELKYEMERWVNMEATGWYSADDHIHIRRSPRENPLILKWVEAEGLNVGVMLQMGDFWATYFSQYAFGEDGVYKENNSMLSTGQEEPRTHQVGHTIALVADDFVRYKNEYYEYDHVFDRVHELKGITGYAHQGMSFNGSRGMTMDVLSGRVDFLELLQFCVEGGPLLTQNYYHFLDLGYKLTATAGSDFPWCGNGPKFGMEEEPEWNARIGNARFYTHIDDSFEYTSWKENLVAGHTFVTSGPMLQLKVNDKLPGDELNLTEKGEISISAAAFGNTTQIPLSKLEIIAHGKVIKEIVPDGKNNTLENLSLDFDWKVDKGVWVAARCFAGPNQVAHTTPIYISINNNGFQNDSTWQDYLALNEKYMDELEHELQAPNDRADKRAWWYRKELKQRIEDTRQIIEKLKKE